MKKIIFQKLVPLVLVLIALGVTYYFYQQGEISFLPKKGSPAEEKTISVELPISDKEYKLSYEEKSDSAFDIANFENNENWYGDGEFDYSTSWEGETSLFLSSYDNQKATATLEKKFDIEGVLNFKFLIYLATERDKLEEFNLIFAGRDFGYKFPIRELTPGWNFLVLPKENFSFFTIKEPIEEVSPGSKQETLAKPGIDRVVIELVSRPKTRSIVNLDFLWAEKEEEYQKDWNADADKFLSIKENKDSGSLLAINLNGSRATLKKGSAKNYTFQAKFTPVKGGPFGFFLRGDYKTGEGYYLLMNGAGTDNWQIHKYGVFDEKTQTIDLLKGKINNFKMEKNQPYWLKAEMKGLWLNLYFSVDGKSFTKLGEVNDASFPIGGIGITVGSGNMVFVDDLQFFQ